jgi:hypothetical protein
MDFSRKKKIFHMKIIISIAFVMGILLTGCVNFEGTLKIKGKVIDKYTKTHSPEKHYYSGINRKKRQISANQFW